MFPFQAAAHVTFYGPLATLYVTVVTTVLNYVFCHFRRKALENANLLHNFALNFALLQISQLTGSP
jgi:hypothetical protein